MKDFKYPQEFNKRIPYFNEFMNKYAKSTYQKKRNKLIKFSLFMENEFNITDITQAKAPHIIEYFKQINKKDVLRDTKQNYRKVLNSYYKFIKEIKNKLEGDKYFTNPVPSINLFDFSEKPMALEDIESKEDIISNYEIVEKVLNYLYFTRPTIFVIVSLLLYTGARISEIISIRIENIDLQERFFFTKVKGKKNQNRHGVYFFPSFFVKYLVDYLDHLRIEFSKTDFLFPSPKGSKSKLKYLSSNTVRKHLREIKNSLGLTCAINPHAFRDFINTERFDKDLNQKYRTLLLNQSPKGVNVKNYLKKYKKRKELQRIYDRTLPFPEFKPKIKR